MPSPVTGAAAIAQDAQTVGAFGFASGFVNPGSPNLADFLTFLATEVQVPSVALPSTSPWPSYALAQAVALVPSVPNVPGIVSTIVTYNCATHILFSITPDVTGENYFQNFRAANHLTAPLNGIVVSTSDQGTSASLTAPEWAGRLTVDQLDFYRTPWGRAYLSFAQKVGPSIVGLT